MVGGMISECFKCIAFIMHFISNLMPPLIWQQVPGWGPLFLKKQELQIMLISITLDFPGGSDSKTSAYNMGDPGSIPGLERSPGEGNGTPLQYSYLENPMDGGTW